MAARVMRRLPGKRCVQREGGALSVQEGLHMRVQSLYPASVRPEKRVGLHDMNIATCCL